MNPNRMTVEPNQQNPTSVFGFDSYPPLSAVNWNQTNPFTSNISPNIPRVQNDMFNINSGLSSQSFNRSSLSDQRNPVQFQHFNNFTFGTPRPTPEIVQFPFSSSTMGFGTREFRCKRKTDSPSLQPAKQLITEEKVAEHLARLHINSETAEPKENETNRMQRLYMCEEMRKFQMESILPSYLTGPIQRPCTALVLWKPPTRLIDPVPNNEVNENNNKDNVVDNDKSENLAKEDEMNEAGTNVMDLDTC
ncbi:uncharacterized protein LOC130896387 [Diorhabda carinulata]|uniref:uncharacterized protein LOC130896387 n=1 Tax=Diorhabda carinulata TaxID=1163345 RepID=UPI0025A290D6|nr:uncharacterized protein LOC130896387 [Diorhabda carinulata]